jgi:hypothetical protein
MRGHFAGLDSASAGGALRSVSIRRRSADRGTWRCQLVDREAAVKKAYDAAKKAMQGGIDHESPEEIRLAQPALDDAVKKIDYGLDVCERMQGEAQAVLEDKPFVEAHRTALTKMISHAAEMKKLYADWAKELRALQQQADSTAKTAHQGSRETEAELGGLKNRASLLAANILACKKEFPQLEKTARQATDKDDDKTAEVARLKLLDLLAAPERQVTALRPLIKHFQSEHAGIDREQKAELQYVVDGLQDAEDTLKAGKALFNDLIKIKQQAAADRAQRPPPPVPKAELVKAAAAVGIDAKNTKALERLADILNDTPHDKWGDALGKLAAELKLKNANGKAMVQAIDRLPYFRKRAEGAH